MKTVTETEAGRKSGLADVPLSDIRVEGRHRKDLGDLKPLMQSIRDVGLLHPVVISPDMRLIAGERRLEALRRLGETHAPCRVVVTVDEAAAALRAERDENECRKDFTLLEMVSMAAALEPFERAAAEKRQEATQGNRQTGTAKFSAPDKGRALDKVASAVGTSRETLRKAREVLEAAEAEPELFAPIAARMAETNKADWAFREVNRIRTAQKAAVEFPTGKYRVIYADPPWQMGGEVPGYMAAITDHYPTMPLSEICALPVAECALPDAVLFLWATSPLLPQALQVMAAWGFTYKASFVWDKVAHNIGHYNSVRHELLLVGTTGSCQPDNRKLFDSVQSVERTRHSEKPAVFREIIETLYPIGTRLELFARQAAPGWDAYGNEVGVRDE